MTPPVPMPTEVTLLTQPACALCDHAKQVLARVATDHPLQIVEIELASERGRRLSAGAWMVFAPGILLDGRPFGYGRLSERKLRKTLRCAATTTPTNP
jgi:hypothetical protein